MQQFILVKKKTRSMILSEAETAYASGAPEFNRDF